MQQRALEKCIRYTDNFCDLSQKPGVGMKWKHYISLFSVGTALGMSQAQACEVLFSNAAEEAQSKMIVVGGNVLLAPDTYATHVGNKPYGYKGINISKNWITRPFHESLRKYATEKTTELTTEQRQIFEKRFEELLLKLKTIAYHPDETHNLKVGYFKSFEDLNAFQRKELWKTMSHTQLLQAACHWQITKLVNEVKQQATQNVEQAAASSSGSSIVASSKRATTEAKS